MPTPPDRPDGSDDPFAVAEAALAARDTGPVDRPTEAVGRAPEAVDRPTEAVGRATEAADRPTEATRTADRPTVMVDDRVLGERPTVRVPGPRRPVERGRRA